MTLSSANASPEAIRIGSGRPLPLGVTPDQDGINFAVFSRHATRMDLVIFSAAGDEAEWATVALQTACFRTGDIWHVRLTGLPPSAGFAWRAHGPDQPEEGHRFDPETLLFDPYALALVGVPAWDAALGRATTRLARSEGPAPPLKPKCLVAHPEGFDWHGDCPLGRPWSDTVIYETHVRGLTIHPSAGIRHPGTFLGVIDRVPYFRALGVTALELMPVHEFFSHSRARRDPGSTEPQANYWGYDTAAFFAPKESYGTGAFPGCQVTEFKAMVRELHRAGIEVILDVVFNHTAEGDEAGPTLSFRGLDNLIYYVLAPDRRRYLDYSGCGNTLNCSHPVVRDYILDCLRYWVIEMHVDGFRFDLASVLGRDSRGRLQCDPPLLERIAEDPILRHVKLIAEAWDAGGAYQVGSFPGQRWSEWNGRYRDDVRRYWRGDAGMAGDFASRLCGSADIYERSGKQPVHSINFVTAHDGFTLNDLVSYARKHNEANGEGNRDGTDANFSDNHGVEGPSDDKTVEAVRQRQIRNLLATLLISRGVPMLLGGDEFRRTQLGNNNAYCQDNALSWYDWKLADANSDLIHFTRRMIAFRKQHRVLSSPEFYAAAELIWFGADGGQPGWQVGGGELGCGIRQTDGALLLCLLFNPGLSTAVFQLPLALRGCRWQVAVDTASSSGFPDGSAANPAINDTCTVAERSLQVLVRR